MASEIIFMAQFAEVRLRELRREAETQRRVQAARHVKTAKAKALTPQKRFFVTMRQGLWTWGYE